MKFSEILFSEYDENRIPVSIYFAAYSNSIVGIRCALTKQTYFKQGFNQLNLGIQKKEMEKVIFELSFKQAISNWIERIVIREHKNIIINILDRVKIEAFLLFANKKFFPLLTSTTQIKLRKFPFHNFILD
ncbi:hypothetical protein PRO82_000355 [Candidatus Protochlamydia amoebophila]|uniref:hypothetical protein n=1 Tax=Candidatus Protochlamydia amoebophila TaxID=362787 RepID=UPI001BC9522F|nr:hypothetical protein [Candidatus Protochlamydia amoebophila]MBS4163066.1 hypothetical protein [Candidatus Protochlamydia amoebophila]